MIGAVREGNLGEKLKNIPIAVIACSDPLSPHTELYKLKINLFIDYVANAKYQRALSKLITEVR